ncbi:beta-eliminating lyase [Thozetella sp. PMI_491]|nr:beta-eliminating lyase [Thozetella sp. PMI_491]
MDQLGEAHDRDKACIGWGHPERTGAAYDFRSDVVTTPSEGMLAAIANATLQDDVFREDQATLDFERAMADLCGHEDGAFVITGTMANQLALRALLGQPPHAVLVDAQSHLVHFEAGGIAFLSGALVQAIRPRNGRYLVLEDVAQHAVRTDDVHKCPTRAVSIENTAAGGVVPLAELKRIRAWAATHDIAVHMDGARLWEAVAAGAGTVRDFAQCCDVLTLDFSKNLGAPMGAMVLGSAALQVLPVINRLRRLRKGIGGGMRAAGVLAAAARQAVLENFGPGQTDTRGVLAQSHTLAQRAAQMWLGKGGRLSRPAETNMLWLDLRAAALSAEALNALGRKHGIRLDGKRLVFHHQICEAAMQRLNLVMTDALGGHQEASHGAQSSRGGRERARL